MTKLVKLPELMGVQAREPLTLETLTKLRTAADAVRSSTIRTSYKSVDCGNAGTIIRYANCSPTAAVVCVFILSSTIGGDVTVMLTGA